MSVKRYSAKQFSCFSKMVENETDAKPFGNVAMNKENDRKAILFFFFCGTKINYPYYPLD